MLCRITRFCCLSLLIALLGLPALAQDVTTRGEDAFSTDDGALIVHVAVPRGQIIQEGRLSHSDLAEAVVLRPDPEPLREVRWFILDASGEMLNAAPFVKDAIQRFISADQPRVSYGVIVYDSRPRILVPPTTDAAALIRELDNYSGTAGQVGCVGDALVALRSLGRSPDEARRVLLVVGPLTRQGTCSENAVQSVGVPVDMIVIADDVEGFYLDIAERSQGVLKRANLQTVSARFEEVKTQWLQPIYALRGRSPQPLGGQSSLRVLFTDSSSAPALVRVSGILLTPTPSGPVLQRPATATPPPTDVPPPTIFIPPTFTAPPVVVEQASAIPPEVALLSPATETPVTVALLPSATPFVPSVPSATPLFAPLPSLTPLPIGQPLNQPTSAAPRPARVTFTPAPTNTPPPTNTPAPSDTPAPPSPSDTPAPPSPSDTPVSLAALPTQPEAAPSDTPAPPSPSDTPVSLAALPTQAQAAPSDTPVSLAALPTQAQAAPSDTPVSLAALPTQAQAAPSDTPVSLAALPTQPEAAPPADEQPEAAPSDTPVSLAALPTQAQAAPPADEQPEAAPPASQDLLAVVRERLTALTAALTTTNPLILAGGGLALLALLIGLVALLSVGRQQRHAAKRRADPVASDYTTLDPSMNRDQTMIDPALMQANSPSTGLDFYGGAAKPLSKEELRRQAAPRPSAGYDDEPPRPAPKPAPRPPQVYSDEEDMVLTSVLDDSDFQQMQAQSGGEVIAWLRLDSKPPRDYELRAAGLSIGRKPDNDIVVSGDNAISGQHARLEVSADGGVTLLVLSKTNPVVISGVMLRENERRALRSQDVIQLSPNTRLIFIARAEGDQASFDEEMTLL